jgi:hypothetical protein
MYILPLDMCGDGTEVDCPFNAQAFRRKSVLKETLIF